VNGERQVTREVSRVNGETTEIVELDSVVLSEPVEKVVSVGSTPKIRTATGTISNFSGGAGVIADAYSLIGIPYRSGGASPSAGFDCSGFVSYVFGINGMSLPNTASGISLAGTVIPLSEAQPGDVVGWGIPSSSYHVGIYVGGGAYIDAPTPGRSVLLRTFGDYCPSYAVRF